MNLINVISFSKPIREITRSCARVSKHNSSHIVSDARAQTNTRPYIHTCIHTHTHSIGNRLALLNTLRNQLKDLCCRSVQHSVFLENDHGLVTIDRLESSRLKTTKYQQQTRARTVCLFVCITSKISQYPFSLIIN